MIIATCEINIMLFNINSLKDKRMVLKSLIKKVQNKFNVSIAEIDLNDTLNMSIIGFACVTNETKHGQSMITNILNFIENNFPIEVTNIIQEIF